MLLNILVTMVIVAALVGLLWLIQSFMFASVPVSKNTRIQVNVKVKGPAPELEQTMDALMWLRQNGVLKAELCLYDEGMDIQTRRTAEIISRHGMIELK